MIKHQYPLIENQLNKSCNVDNIEYDDTVKKKE